MPSPYGPRLPWHFPFCRSFWLSGDVTQGLGLMPVLKGLLSRLLWRNPGAQAYEQGAGPASLMLIHLNPQWLALMALAHRSSHPLHVMKDLHR